MSKVKSKIGFFGIPGSFTYKSAQSYFGKEQDFISTSTFREIFLKVSDGSIDYGVIPIENTLAGSIYENYDLLDEFKLFITGEVNARVSHSLLMDKTSTKNITTEKAIKGLRKVYSHEKALEQCSNFFKSNPLIKPVAYTSTAHAAEFVSKCNDKSIAAIADSANASIYNLKIIKSAVENNKYNFTRFLILQKNTVAISNANKCSLLIKLPHKTGSLSSILDLLSKNNCNLTKIESRPIRTQPFEYVFYIEFIFDNGNSLNDILRQMKAKSLDVIIFGIYKVN